MRMKLMFSSIPFNLWRACHWYNNPIKKGSRPSKEDYKYYFTHNVHITTSGNFSTAGLKFCIEELGVERCLYAIGNTHFPLMSWWVANGLQTLHTKMSRKDKIGGRQWICLLIRKRW
jgi:hypothetical protein